PDPTPTPTPIPGPTPTPTPAPAETVAENVANGKAAMESVLVTNTTAAARQSATQKLVKAIDQSSASATAKSGQITGVILAIMNDGTMSDAEKISLQQEVVNEFTPASAAKANKDNALTSAAQSANAAPRTTAAQAEAAAPSEESEESPVTGL
ncbi:MAG: hypothetical protein IJ812_00710, partial [Schwartzia sp.]|nr:hypothetical protein [Schwartzia sp. (in: firmicutes)]